MDIKKISVTEYEETIVKTETRRGTLRDLRRELAAVDEWETRAVSELAEIRAKAQALRDKIKAIKALGVEDPKEEVAPSESIEEPL
jgi:uncharacterized sporulation protein YeaH/YhbH (DUF444 family)